VKTTQKIAGALIAPLLLATTPLPAVEHLVPTSEIRQQITAQDQARSANVDRLTEFFEAPAAQRMLAKSGMDAAEIVSAVSVLDDESLSRLAAQAFDAQQDVAAGSLTNQQLTYIVIALGTAVLILVIVAA
jgi:hypothetical protein